MIRTIFISSYVVIIGVALTGCYEQSKTVDYYLQHPDERAVHLKDCVNKYGKQLRNAPMSCETAATAKSKAFIKDAINARK